MSLRGVAEAISTAKRLNISTTQQAKRFGGDRRVLKGHAAKRGFAHYVRYLRRG